MTSTRPRMIVMISGSGSNLQALIDAKRWDIVLVVSNREGAYGVTRAREANVPTLVFTMAGYTSRRDYDRDLASRLLPYRPDVVVLAGFMHILSTSFLEQFPHQVINLHPALPNAFNGMHAIRRAWEAKQTHPTTGVMVHHVIPEVDQGTPILVREVAMDTFQDYESFEAHMHHVEHEVIVEAVAKYFADQQKQPS